MVEWWWLIVIAFASALVSGIVIGRNEYRLGQQAVLRAWARVVTKELKEDLEKEFERDLSIGLID